MSHLAELLFARPSFVSGIARLVDWGGTLNEYSYSLSGASDKFMPRLAASRRPRDGAVDGDGAVPR